MTCDLYSAVEAHYPPATPRKRLIYSLTALFKSFTKGEK